MFEILSPKEIMQITKTAKEDSEQERLTQKEKEQECFRLTLGRVAKAEQKHTLKQVYDWLEGTCEEHNLPRRFCTLCWAGLEKEANSE